jgi:hypothetical protein
MQRVPGRPFRGRPSPSSCDSDRAHLLNFAIGLLDGAGLTIRPLTFRRLREMNAATGQGE